MQGKKKLYSVINAKVSHSLREKAFKKKNLTNDQKFDFLFDLIFYKIKYFKSSVLTQHFHKNITTKSRW